MMNLLSCRLNPKTEFFLVGVVNVKQSHMVSCDKLNNLAHTFDLAKHNETKQHYLNSSPNPEIQYMKIFDMTKQ